MRKPELVDAVQSVAGLDTKTQAEAAVDAVFDAITKSLASGEEVTLTVSEHSKYRGGPLVRA